MTKTKLYPSLEIAINRLQFIVIPEGRKIILQELIDYIAQKMPTGEKPKLVFICTHNSRRSQLAQIWAKTMGNYFNIDIECYSGGTEVTAFNQRAVSALKRAGFNIEMAGKENPVYRVLNMDQSPFLTCWSKLYNDNTNPSGGFAAVMTCSEADRNCPFIPGAEIRIPLSYDDPKAFDGSPEEAVKYDERSRQIASEMFYVFSNIKK